MATELIIFASDALAPELEALSREADFANVALIPIPICGVAPAASWATIQGVLAQHAPTCPAHLLACPCLAGRLPSHLLPGRISVHQQSHCLEALAGAGLVAGLQRSGAFVVSVGWLATWQQRLVELVPDPMAACGRFSTEATRIVLLDSGVAPEASSQLAEFAQFVARPAECLAVGLDHVRLMLNGTSAEGPPGARDNGAAR